MTILTNQTEVVLWHEVVKHAENTCCVTLKQELEAYLVSLLIRYTNQPEVAKQILAIPFLRALCEPSHQRQILLQHVGDHCLLFTGLFPGLAESRHVKISYFVSLGRSAYINLSGMKNDLYSSLASQFVELMDVLQSIRPHSDLLPLEAYELWKEVGSKRALQTLKKYTQAIPQKW